jgi:orotidine-5'-phosphate decarboxylase
MREANPELLTTMCVAGLTAMRALKAELPDTEVLGVTVLTSLKDADTQSDVHLFDQGSRRAVRPSLAAKMRRSTGSSRLRKRRKCSMRDSGSKVLSLNTPAIRPTWAIVPGDDQNPDRIMTPAKAIRAGADRIVVGRPIVKAENPYDAVMRTIEEIDSAMQ